MTAAYVAFDQEWYVLLTDIPELADIISHLFKKNSVNFNCTKQTGRNVRNMVYFFIPLALELNI